MLILKEHKSSSYAPRTYYNAAQGVTLAVAVDHNTAGRGVHKKLRMVRLCVSSVELHTLKQQENCIRCFANTGAIL